MIYAYASQIHQTRVSGLTPLASKLFFLSTYTHTPPTKTEFLSKLLALGKKSRILKKHSSSWKLPSSYCYLLYRNSQKIGNELWMNWLWYSACPKQLLPESSEEKVFIFLSNELPTWLRQRRPSKYFVPIRLVWRLIS